MLLSKKSKFCFSFFKLQSTHRKTKDKTCHRTSLSSKPVFTSTEVYAKVFTLQDKVRKENGYIKKEFCPEKVFHIWV